MALSIDEVRRIADLARLRLSAREEEIFAVQLAQIIDYFDQLKAFATQEVAATESPVLEAADVPGPTMERELLLANAPEVLESFILVPQVKTTADE